MARHLCRIAVSIVVAALLATAPGARAAESQRLKVGSRLTVTLTETKPFIYRVTAKVVEVLPNGVLVIGMRTSDVFDNCLSVYSLSGKINPRNVAADGSVLSDYIADLKIAKQLIHLSDCIGPF